MVISVVKGGVLVPLSGNSPEYFPPPRMIWFKLSVRPRLRNLAVFPWAWIQIIGVPPCCLDYLEKIIEIEFTLP